MSEQLHLGNFQMHREKRPRRGAALVVLVAALAVAGVASMSAPPAGGVPSARSGFSVVAPQRLAPGDVVRVVVPEGLATASGRLCNTDPAIPDDGSGCSEAVPAVRGADGRVEYAVPVRLGRIGSSDLAYCPPAPSLNSPGTECVIVIETSDGPVAVAEVVVKSAEGGTGSQQIGVVVHRDSPVTTVGSTVPSPTSSTSTTTYVPPTTSGLPRPSVVPAGGPGAVGGWAPGERPAVARGPLATTGPARVVSLSALGIALLDLGWLLLSAARSRDRAALAATLRT